MAKTAMAVTMFAFLVFAMTAPTVFSIKTTQLTLYFELISNGPSAGVIPIAGPLPRTPFTFGTLFAGDSRARFAASLDSPVIGRGGGFILVSKVNGKEVFYSFSIIFNEASGVYSGSTLELQGTVSNSLLGNSGEISVNGGTEYFRFASGFCVVSTAFQNPSTFTTVLRTDITIKYGDRHVM